MRKLVKERRDCSDQRKNWGIANHTHLDRSEATWLHRSVFYFSFCQRHEENCWKEIICMPPNVYYMRSYWLYAVRSQVWLLVVVENSDFVFVQGARLTRGSMIVKGVQIDHEDIDIYVNWERVWSTFVRGIACSWGLVGAAKWYSWIKPLLDWASGCWSCQDKATLHCHEEPITNDIVIRRLWQLEQPSATLINKSCLEEM